MAFKNVLKTDQVAVVFFGDGASNRGTFHEAMNAASAWKLPVVFVNEMNCWASTTPYRTTCNVENISDRAAGYHIPGVVVDGQDPFAVSFPTRRSSDLPARDRLSSRPRPTGSRVTLWATPSCIVTTQRP